mgnify:CR=1 FL=1
MSFVKVYIHYVWGTKDRFPFLDSPELRQKIWDHIQQNAENKGIYLDFVNGYKEHCHCLVSLGSNQTIEKVAQLLKGESSNWINKNGLTQPKFGWQNEYFALSVSESILDKVRNYIKNQEKHHEHKTYQEEYDELMTKYGFVKYKG